MHSPQAHERASLPPSTLETPPETPRETRPQKTPFGGSPAATRRRPWLKPFVLRLHFYAGVFVAPFILLAALTGAAYAVTPQLEKLVYAQQLTSAGHAGDSQLPLAQQIAAAQAYTGGGVIQAVRPAPDAGQTTRVLYPEPADEDGGLRTVFVDPTTAQIRGEFTSYTSLGQSPMRHWLEGFHSSLHLGEAGQKYSELAASWLGIIAAAGLFLWAWTWRKTRKNKRAELLKPAVGRGPRRLHLSTGIWALAGMLFLSATGITWSQWAGANVGELRAAWGWTSPQLNSSLGGTTTLEDEHAAHHGAAAAADGGNLWSDPAAFTQVLSLARMNGIGSAQVEIVPPSSPEKAWVVKETRAQFPTAANQVAIDRANGTATDRVDFASQPFAAQLTTWGIALHMGDLFGVWNQAALLLLALGIIVVIVAGYRMWFARRPAGLRSGLGAPAFRPGDVPWWGWAAFAAAGLALGLFLPALGLSLVVFLVLDAAVLAWRARVTGRGGKDSGR
ncbi:PepSY-associated TM helix domain-containing protein [Galactobacter valiniphilus]|uniref:PepSY-associated TM helix domain-containing protein n=1 Tax=Galactobacter valiniphilus TaxID=2676122 RepID=UPI003735E6D1